MPGRSDRDLRRRSFRGLDLHGEALDDADLRGADFTGADLHDADLHRVRTGMRPGWAAGLVGIGLVTSALLGVASGLAGRRVEAMLASSDFGTRASGILAASSLVVLVLGLIWKGPRYVLAHVFPVLVAVVGVAGLTAGSLGIGRGTGALGAILLVVLGLLVVVLGALARALAGTAGRLFFVVVALAGMVAASSIGGGAITTALVLSAMIAGQRTLHGHAGFPLLDRVTRTLACAGGTSFRGADLRGARFDAARLSAADFRGAQLERASFEGAKTTFCLFDDGRYARR